MSKEAVIALLWVLSASVSFGIWMHSIAAGIFLFAAVNVFAIVKGE